MELKMLVSQTVEEMENDLWEKLKLLQLSKDVDQGALATRAAVSVRALRNLQGGTSTTVKFLLRVISALARGSWRHTVASVSTISPLTLTYSAAQRLRARNSRCLPTTAFRAAAALRTAASSNEANPPKAASENFEIQ